MVAGTEAARQGALLDVADLSVRFGGIVALDGLSLRVQAGINEIGELSE